MAKVSLVWQITEAQGLSIEVETDASHPDALDELCHRAVYLLNKALTEVTEPEATAP